MKKLLGVLLMLLLFFNLYLLYKNNKLVVQLEQIPTIINEYKAFEECYKNVVCLNSTLIGSNISLYSDGKAYQLEEIIGDQTQFIFYYSEENCQKCIIDELQKISSFFPESLKNRIILIEHTRDLNSNFNHPFNFKCYATNQLLFENSVLKLLSKYPILFLVDKDFMTHSVYIPTPLDPNLTTIYLTKIKNIINSDRN